MFTCTGIEDFVYAFATAGIAARAVQV